MADRDRVVVVLYVAGRTGDEIVGLQRAVGRGKLPSMAPHVTISPPTNIAATDRDAVLEVVAGAAARTAPIDVVLGPLDSFAPRNGVRYLSVSPVAPLAALVERCQVGPLDRPRERRFVPHVTVARSREKLPSPDPLLELLDGYRQPYRFTRITVAHQPRREGGGPPRWVDLFDVDLGPPAVIGRGGLELTITTGSLVPPDARSLMPALEPADAGRLVAVGRVAGDDGQPVVAAVTVGEVAGSMARVTATVESPAGALVDAADHVGEAWAHAAARAGATTPPA